MNWKLVGAMCVGAAMLTACGASNKSAEPAQDVAPGGGGSSVTTQSTPSGGGLGTSRGGSVDAPVDTPPNPKPASESEAVVMPDRSPK